MRVLTMGKMYFTFALIEKLQLFAGSHIIHCKYKKNKLDGLCAAASDGQEGKEDGSGKSNEKKISEQKQA